MTTTAARHKDTIDEAIAHLVSRAENIRGLDAADIKPRVEHALDKYLFLENDNVAGADIINFVADLRADDLCLIISCENGDEKAWEDLVANFDSTVKSAARKISPNTEDAEDLAGSIWAELFGLRTDSGGNRKSKLAYYSGRGSLAGWLRAVVSQLAVDQFRKQSKFVQFEEDREFENAANAAFERSDHPALRHADDPEEAFSQQQTGRDVADTLKLAVEELESEDRLILKLYYFDDLKLKDIALTFGYHEATASRKLVRVQKEIRRSVEHKLRDLHGWNDDEIKRYLAESAAATGMSFEKLLGIVAMFVLMQDLLG